MISFNRLRGECAEEEARLVTREEKMGATDGQALTVHTRKNFKKKEKKEKKEKFHHYKKKDNIKKEIKIDSSNVRCYTSNEKGHFEKYCPTRKRRHHAHC